MLSNLAKKIVHAAGGNILVESEPGKGSRFILHLLHNAKYKTLKFKLYNYYAADV
jgi:signal transduction histidine kinase